MAFSIYQGHQETENTFLYYVSYGMKAAYNSWYTPNMIKANVKDDLGKNIKVKMERHYRKKMNQGKSFQIHVTFLKGLEKVK